MPYKPQEVIKALKRMGFVEKRQSGSHVILEHQDGRVVVIPRHQKTMKKGLFNKILKDLGLSIEAFRQYL